ncbi:MAG: cysteine desulfurase-like protein [Trebonia sp.]|uniref:cysteine desulfurase-like protein n=2 Tax=Trebonia sp. TaxID=2767075 RepID=UPI003C720721
MATTFDVARVRGSYPALADGHAYLDGAAGTQVPGSVIDAIAAAYRAGIGNIGGAFAASERSDAIVAEARRAVADLTGGAASGVVFGPSMTALTYRMSAALARGWAPGDEIVVSRLDHDANIRPWIQAAARAGAVVRWAEADLATGELPAAQYAELVGDRTRLVAVTAASNVLGTRPDVAAIAAVAHAAGALCYVDGVHATPHIPVDVSALGADFYATSAYKWAGPHVAAVVAGPALLETLWPDKLAPSSDEVPARFERGTLPFADLAGVAAAVEHLTSLTPGAASGGSRRERLLASMTAVEEYEMALFARLLDGLGAMSHVTLYGKAARRTPTAFFTVAGLTPREVASRLAARGVNVWNGDNYAYELCGALGLEPDGAVRAGLVHYNDASDVDRLLAGVGELAG